MVEITSNGFLLSPQDWDEEVAQRLASYENIKLTKRHWEVIFFIRNYYLDFKALPTVHKICAYIGMNTLEIYTLFPSGPVYGACRIAGIAPDFIFK